MMDLVDFRAFALAMGVEAGEREMEGFSAYLAGLQGTMLHLIVDISPASVEVRKKRFWGHVDGYHPALVWHFWKFMGGETQGQGNP